MLHFYSWMEVDSLHHDYMCLVTVYSQNGINDSHVVWEKDVEKLYTGKSVEGKVILAGGCKWGGFPAASSSFLKKTACTTIAA